MKALRNDLSDDPPPPTAQFTKADLKKVRSEIFNRAPIMANRFMAYLGWCEMGNQEPTPSSTISTATSARAGNAEGAPCSPTPNWKAVWNATFALEAEAGEGNAISRAQERRGALLRPPRPVFDAYAAAAR